jgi:hypothetical protein
MGETIPKVFNISVRNYEELYVLRKGWNGLTYYRFTVFNGREVTESKTIRPSKEQWQAFMQKIDGLGVWDWSPDYPNPGILDPRKWEINIAAGNRWISSRGEGHYPQNGCPDERGRRTSKVFADFLSAVQELIGNLPFS